MRLKLFTSIILLWCTFAAYGQKRPHIRHNHKRTNVDTAITQAYMDSLKTFKAKTDSIFRINESMDTFPENDPRYFKLFAPLTFYYSVAKCRMVLDKERPDDIDAAIDKALMTAYLRHPEYVVSTEDEIRKAGSLHEEITKPLRHKVEYVTKNDLAHEKAPEVPLKSLWRSRTSGHSAETIIYNSCKISSRIIGTREERAITQCLPVLR